MSEFFHNASISKIHGTARKINGRIYFAMYHPAAALHQGSLRKTIEADILKLPVIMAQNNDAGQNVRDGVGHWSEFHDSRRWAVSDAAPVAEIE